MRPFRYKVFNLFKKSILFPDAVSSTVHGFCWNFFCWIYPFFYNFVLLISIRNKKMKSWFHPGSPTYKQNKKPPTLPPYYSLIFPDLPSHYTPTLEHSTADREVPGWNLGVPYFLEVKFTSPCRLCLARVPWPVR